MSHTIKVGVCDWSRFMSAGGFYPDDLPRAWELDYYSNEFETACINLSAIQAPLTLLQQWVEDLDDKFELFFRLERLDQVDLVKQLQQQTGVSISGLLLEHSMYHSFAHHESLLSPVAQSGMGANIRLIDVEDLWTPVSEKDNSLIALLPAPDDIRQCRSWIEQWLLQIKADHPSQDLTLWLDAASTSYSMLSECRTLVELMGH